MTNNSDSLRVAAIACIVGAVATVIGAVLVQGVVQPATSVPDDRWSYPWSSAALVPISLVWASLHVLVFVGVFAFGRSGLAGRSFGARVGVPLALAGTALLFVSELASIPVRNEHTDDAGATVVGAMFGLATLLTAAGFLGAGIATLRAGRWDGWGRYTPLAVGVAAVVLLGIGFTHALPSGVGAYGLCLLAFGVALYAQATQRVPRSVALGEAG